MKNGYNWAILEKTTDLGSSGGGQPSAAGGGGFLWRSGLAEGGLEEMNIDLKKGLKMGQTWMTFEIIVVYDNLQMILVDDKL